MAEQHRVNQLAAAENKKKIGEEKKVSKIRKAFARVPLAAFRLGGGGGGGAGRKQMAKDKSTDRPKKMLPHNPHRKGKDKRYRKHMREKKRGELNG